MKIHSFLILPIAILAMSGCVSRYALLEHPITKEQKYCSNKGWGWIGAPLAISEHNDCLDQLQAQGYKTINNRPSTNNEDNKKAGDAKASASSLATTEYQNGKASVSEKTINSKNGYFKITLPSGWIQKKPPQALQNVDVQVYAENPQKDLVLLITTENASDIQDLSGYGKLLQSKLSEELSESNSSGIHRINVNGHDAIRFDTSGIAQGVKVHYLMTVLQTEKELIKLNGWTVESKFHNSRRELEALTEEVYLQ